MRSALLLLLIAGTSHAQMAVTDNGTLYFTSNLSTVDGDTNPQSKIFRLDTYAVTLIVQNYGVLNVEKDLDAGLSPRQLRRLFEYYVGDSAKTFCQVVRFQNILRAKPSQQSLRESKLFYDNGYYDQAHFIKEFRNFYGVTPGKAFGR